MSSLFVVLLSVTIFFLAVSIALLIYTALPSVKKINSDKSSEPPPPYEECARFEHESAV